MFSSNLSLIPLLRIVIAKGCNGICFFSYKKGNTNELRPYVKAQVISVISKLVKEMTYSHVASVISQDELCEECHSEYGIKSYAMSISEYIKLNLTKKNEVVDHAFSGNNTRNNKVINCLLGTDKVDFIEVELVGFPEQPEETRVHNFYFFNNSSEQATKQKDVGVFYLTASYVFVTFLISVLSLFFNENSSLHKMVARFRKTEEK